MTSPDFDYILCVEIDNMQSFGLTIVLISCGPVCQLDRFKNQIVSRRAIHLEKAQHAPIDKDAILVFSFTQFAVVCSPRVTNHSWKGTT